MIKTFLTYKLIDICIDRIFESFECVFGDIDAPKINVSDPKLIKRWRRLLECDIGERIPRSHWSICAASFETQLHLNRTSDYTWKKYSEFSQYLLPIQRRLMGDISAYRLSLGTFPPESSHVYQFNFERFRSLPEDLKAYKIEEFYMHVQLLFSHSAVFNGMYFHSHPDGVEILL